MNSKEDTDIIDLVKDYLKQHGLKSTLECLEKEENYKSIVNDKKKVKIILIYSNI